MLQRRQVHRTEGAGAGCIDDAVRPMQIQAIGDPPGHHVAEQPRKRVLLPRHVRLADPLDDIGRDVIRNAGITQCVAPFRMPETGAQRNDHLQRAGHTQNAADPRAVELATGSIARVLQRPLRRHQAQQLSRIDRLQIIGRNAVLQRIERHRRQKASAPGVGHVRSFRVLIEVVLRSPMGRRHFADAVDAAADVGPELVQPLRLRKQTARPDDRQRRHACTVARRCLVVAHAETSSSCP